MSFHQCKPELRARLGASHTPYSHLSWDTLAPRAVMSQTFLRDLSKTGQDRGGRGTQQEAFQPLSIHGDVSGTVCHCGVSWLKLSSENPVVKLGWAVSTAQSSFRQPSRSTFKITTFFCDASCDLLKKRIDFKMKCSHYLAGTYARTYKLNRLLHKTHMERIRFPS